MLAHRRWSDKLVVAIPHHNALVQPRLLRSVVVAAVRNVTVAVVDSDVVAVVVDHQLWVAAQHACHAHRLLVDIDAHVRAHIDADDVHACRPQRRRLQLVTYDVHDRQLLQQQRPLHMRAVADHVQARHARDVILNRWRDTCQLR